MKISKEAVVSFLQTFVTLFAIEFAYQFTQLPVEQVVSGEVLTAATLIGLVSAAFRSVLTKPVWQKLMPVSFGGKK